MRALTTCLFVVALGCGPFDPDLYDHLDTVSCDSTGDPSSVGGVWIITGVGEQDRCDDDFYNDSQVQLDATVDLTQAGEALALGAKNPTGVDLTLQTGQVSGKCVDLSFREVISTDDGAQAVVITFKGAVGATAVTGTFVRDGPGNCEMKGSFQAVIQ